MSKPISIALVRRSLQGSNGPEFRHEDDEAIALQDVDVPTSAVSTSHDIDFEGMITKSDVAEAEVRPLLSEASSSDRDGEEEEVSIDGWQLTGLYISHTLSMWNSRSYEFAAVLFTASAYPGTMAVASIRGLSANLASLLFSSAVGRWCNRHPSRLRTLQISILLQRLCICLACIGWAIIIQPDGVDRRRRSDDPAKHQNGRGAPVDDHHDRFEDKQWIKTTVMAALILLGMLEKLSAVANVLVMERDWVPILATPTSRPPLHVLNATMKRIDLISKLVAPLFVSVAAIWVQSLRMTTLVIAAIQALSVIPEMVTARRVWLSSPRLQESREHLYSATVTESEDLPIPEMALRRNSSESIENAQDRPSFKERMKIWNHGLHLYFSSPVCAPSLALALQPFSVLTLSASMTTYLVIAHYPLSIITSARTFSTGIEISSTFLTPMLISWLNTQGRRKHGDNHEPLRPLARVGLWGLWWQLLTLVPVTAALIMLPSTADDPASVFPVLTGIIFVFIALSRLGPFGYGLVEQILVQIAVPASQRVEFSGVEMAFVSAAELLRWAMTGIWGRPEQFKGVAVGALASIALATVMFWRWSWKWWPRLGELSQSRITQRE